MHGTGSKMKKNLEKKLESKLPKSKKGSQIKNNDEVGKSNEHIASTPNLDAKFDNINVNEEAFESNIPNPDEQGLPTNEILQGHHKMSKEEERWEFQDNDNKLRGRWATLRDKSIFKDGNFKPWGKSHSIASHHSLERETMNLTYYTSKPSESLLFLEDEDDIDKDMQSLEEE